MLTHNVRAMSDSRRDAERYHKLLLALESATSEIKELELTGLPNLAELIGRLLPRLCEALEAEQAFVASERHDEGARCLEVTAAFPRAELGGRRLPWLGIIRRLGEDGRPKVVDNFDDRAVSL